MKKQSNTGQTLRIYLAHTKKYWRKLMFIYPAMTVAQLLEDVAAPLIISWILTNLANDNIDAINEVGLVVIFCAIVFIELFSNLIWNFVVRVFWKTQDRIMKDLYNSCFDHLQTLSSAFFANRFAGSLVSQVNKFVGAYERLTDALTWNVYKLIISVLATTIIIGARAPLIAVAILVITCIYVPVVWHYRKKLLPLNQKWATAESGRTGQLADSISNVGAVKSFANENLEQKLMRKRVDEVHRRSIETMRMNMNHELITGTIQRSINVAVIILSVYFAVKGVLDVGTIYLALTLTIGILRRLWDLNNTFRTFTRVFGDTYDMTEIFQLQPKVKDAPQAAHLHAKNGKIEFKNVTFNHGSVAKRQKPIFSNLNITIEPGQRVGLVGHSGSGKTTLTRLILRFMDIQNGSITIDGQDIATVTQKSLRNHISYVPQEPLLFHRSLTENIAYGKPDAQEAEVVKAAKLAHAHEFIKELPEQYKTLVGERGVKLSGGQRQRVAIARAMIKDSPILILDEATSALDSESETLIQDALWKLMENKTALVIAHRLSTVQKLDRILVLDNGVVVEDGSHTELLRKNGTYAKLWSHQSGGFLED